VNGKLWLFTHGNILRLTTRNILRFAMGISVGSTFGLAGWKFIGFAHGHILRLATGISVRGTLGFAHGKFVRFAHGKFVRFAHGKFVRFAHGKICWRTNWSFRFGGCCWLSWCP
jgi:hypothetical protein